MALAPIDPKNPLSAIGRSNVRSLGARAEAANKGTMDLQRSLAALNLEGQNTLANTRLSGDINAEAARLLPFERSNIIPGTPTSTTELNTRRLSDIGGIDAAARTNESLAHLNLARLGKRNIYKPGDTATKGLSFERPQEEITPLTIGAAAAGNIKAEEGSSVTYTGVTRMRNGTHMKVVTKDFTKATMKFDSPKLLKQIREKAIKLLTDKTGFLQIKPETVKIHPDGKVTATSYNYDTKKWIENSILHGVIE